MKTVFFIFNSVESQKRHQVLINDLFYFGYDLQIISLFITETSVIKEFAEDQNCLMVYSEKKFETKNRKLRWLPEEINATDLLEEINQEQLVLN